MKIKRTANELILRDNPTGAWLGGLFFILVSSGFAYGTIGGFTNAADSPNYAVWLGLLVGAIGGSVGLWLIASHPLSTIFIDRQTKTVVVARRGLFKKTERLFRFDEVRKFAVERDEDADGDALWKIQLILKPDEAVDITRVWERKQKACAEVAQIANDFLGKL